MRLGPGFLVCPAVPRASAVALSKSEMPNSLCFNFSELELSRARCFHAVTFTSDFSSLITQNQREFWEKL